MPGINMKSTKELARELGLLRKRTSSAGSQYMKRIKKNRQSFAYLIVIDFESTCWQNVKYKTQEIIEFPAVLLNTSTGAVDAEFHHYVQPQEHPYLSDFCRELTGITQDQVDQGIPLSLTIKKFASWLQQLSNERNITYDAFSSHDTKCTFVTWSDWDLGVCLQYETRRKQIRKPVELNSWIDLRATYRNFYQRRPQGLNGALQDLGISFEGREHSGLCDARNTAKLAWRMMTDGCQLQVTKTLTPPLTGRAGPKITIPKAIAAPQAQHCLPNDNSGQPKPQVSVPVNSLRTANGAAVEVTSNQKQNVIGPPRQLMTNQSKTSTSRTTVTSPEDPSETASTELISSYIDCNDTTEEGSTDSRATQQRKSPELHTVVLSTDQKHARENQTRVPILGCSSSTFKMTKTKTKNSVSQGNSFSIYCDKDDRKTKAPRSVTGGPSPIGISNCTSNFKVPSPVGVVKTKVGGPFKTPSPLCGRTFAPTSSSSGRPERKALQNTTNTITPRHTPSVHKPTPVTTPANYRTPNTSGGLLVASSSSMKRTPPMCECGRRTHRKLVQSPGPNQGRAFFCCPAGRKKGTSPLDNTTRGFGGTKKQGCGFFKWETATKDPNLSVTSMTGSFMRNTSSTSGKSVVRTRSFVVPPLPQPNFNTPQSEQRGTTWKTLGSTGSSNTVGPFRY